MYSVRDKHVPQAITGLWKGMTGLDAKKQAIEITDILEVVKAFETHQIGNTIPPLHMPDQVQAQVDQANLERIVVDQYPLTYSTLNILSPGCEEEASNVVAFVNILQGAAFEEVEAAKTENLDQ
ncbi:hypothetical protein TEA_020413 [Camellia sinensis var. sinensis]|uniref:Uncharacterized protein n=1 Tax=Camellia sinensis var. sinensis TaxID=542762 RepID=A0A4S4CVS4_CAMSN|nr:hypothetical protein TEA_020413 [Camellia sinensis var. sinensis]